MAAFGRPTLVAHEHGWSVAAILRKYNRASTREDRSHWPRPLWPAAFAHARGIGGSRTRRRGRAATSESRQLAARLPDVRGWLDLDQAIAESGAEAWVVACSTAEHVRVATKLLQAGKKVLLEKPISESLPDAERLAPLVSTDSSNLMIGHIVLFNSEFKQVREEVAKRGGLSFIDCVRHRPASIVKDFPGENPLQATMVHDLYAVQVLLNRVEPERFSSQFHRTESGAVDLALAQLQWPDGTLASFAASYLTPTGMPPRLRSDGSLRTRLVRTHLAEPAADRSLGRQSDVADGLGNPSRHRRTFRHDGRGTPLLLSSGSLSRSRTRRRDVCRRSASAALDGPIGVGGAVT